MNSFHAYRAFGLNIRSCLEVPQWSPGGPPWDVTVDHGDVPFELPGGVPLWDGKFLGRPGVALLDFAGAGRMRIEDGKRVTVAPAPDGNPRWLATLLANTGFAALLYQRGGLCLHASAVARDGRAYLIMGPSGAGKSTTATALVQRGCTFLSDDITVVTPRAGGGFDAFPSFPTVRLTFDSHAALEFGSAAEALPDPVLDKLHLRHAGPPVREPVRIARICFLAHDPALLRPQVERVRGQESVGVVQRNFFRRSMGRIVADPRELARISLGLVQDVEIVRVNRPTSGFELDELCRLVLG